eukprot:scaffold31746_cov20-Tisochrysis_lutea.AAC.4
MGMPRSTILCILCNTLGILCSTIFCSTAPWGCRGCRHRVIKRPLQLRYPSDFIKAGCSAGCVPLYGCCSIRCGDDGCRLFVPAGNAMHHKTQHSNIQLNKFGCNTFVPVGGIPSVQALNQ